MQPQIEFFEQTAQLLNSLENLMIPCIYTFPNSLLKNVPQTYSLKQIMLRKGLKR